MSRIQHLALVIWLALARAYQITVDLDLSVSDYTGEIQDFINSTESYEYPTNNEQYQPTSKTKRKRTLIW